MTPSARHDAVITAWLADGPTGLPAADRAAIADAAEHIAQRRDILARWRPSNRRSRLAALAVAVAAVLLAAALIGPIVGGPRPTPLVWTPDSVREPYPAPLRNEPWFGAQLVSAELIELVDPRFTESKFWAYVDASGDTAPASVAFADLVSLEFQADCWQSVGLCLRYQTAAGLTRPFADALFEWFVYGVDFDNDGDGRVDVRFGVDNQRENSLRAWTTDLRTGVTYQTVGGGFWPDDWLWKVETPSANGQGVLRNSGYAMLDPELTTPVGHFYAWTAVIRDGRIVSMDFAPDVGWLDSRPEAEETERD